ncbi:MAG: DegV family protein, partial [Anaerolineae bacterium]
EIAVIDSYQLSMALGWQVVLAARAAQAGRSVSEIEASLERVIPRVRSVAVLDSLEHLARGGRLGKAAVLLSSLLNVKPVVQMWGGEASPIGNVRTKRLALEHLVDFVVAQGPFEEVSVPHTNAPDTAQQVAEMLVARMAAFENTLPRERILICEAGASITTHLGLGAVGICGVLAER